MPIIQRPYSANCYALAKVWFKCCVVNLRVQDINAINSLIKSWLYQDLLLKPSELVLFRGNEAGGLGLLNVKIRAMSLLIRTFLETSINPNFQHSLFHEQLFRYHVLQEHCLPDPGYTPYYDKDFFNLLSHYKDTSPMNISIMSTKQWYTTLLEDLVLMNPATENSPSCLIPIRAETLHPTCNWPQTWLNIRTRGLGSELSSFLFKLLHGLLPTQDRVARIGMADDEVLGLCLLCRTEVEDLAHCFFECPKNIEAGLALLGYAQHVVPNLSPENALLLDFQQDLSVDQVHLGVQVEQEDGPQIQDESRNRSKSLHT